MILSDAFCWIGGAFALLVLPLDWVLSAVTAALVHEFCHVIAVFLFRGSIRGIQLGLTGCRMETDSMRPMASVVCILAGPAGSFLMLLAARYLPKIAICALFQGIYNLLPVEPLDGGRVLRIVLDSCCPQQADRVMQTVRYAVFAALIIAAFCLKGIFLPVIGCLALNLALLGRKIPCKENRIGLQWY